MHYANLLLAWPYWLLFSVPALCAIGKRYISQPLENYIWGLYTLSFVLFVGLRHEVGTDWPNYERILSTAVDVPLIVGLGISDPGYGLLNWIGANLFGGIYFPNLICAILAILPLIIFARRQASQWVSLFVVFPWLVVVAHMGFTRQGAAIGMVIMLLMALERSQFRRAILYLTLAALLHRTSIAFTALVFLVTLRSDQDHRVLKAAISIVWGAVIAAFVFGFDIVGKTSQYLIEPLQNNASSSLEELDAAGGASFHSAGAILRTGIGVTAAAGYFIFFAFNRKHEDLDSRKLMWILMSTAQILLFPLAFFASTLADRLAFYLIPLQVHVAAMADAALPARVRTSFRCAVFGTYAIMFVMWLTRSDFASDWLPYDNILTHIW